MRSQIRWACVLSLYAAGSVVGQEVPVRDLPDEKVLVAFYQPDVVQSVHLQISDADLKRMLAALPERIDVPATFRWRDVTVENVAVRFKGNSSSNPKQTHKRSFLIKFDRYDKERRFFGLRQASFDNGIQFGSLFSEPIITEILRDHGIPAHRCNYARLYVNKEYRGVYVNVERIDESFLESRFPGVKGALFKVDEGGPGCNLQYLGDDPGLYRKTFDPRNSAAKKDPARLVEWIKWIDKSEPSEFAKGLQSKLEADDFLRTTAIMLFAGAFDQLAGWNPHNYFLFHDAKRDRWRYLPWDLDVGFCETAFGKIQVLDDWHAAWPVPRTGAPQSIAGANRRGTCAFGSIPQ
ncbi:MAG: CotH kinase family protein [Gemmataceae bacterium]